MDVTLHPDLGLFPAGTTVKAFKRSSLGIVPGTYPAGAPGGSEDASAAVQADGTLTFTALTARETYFGYALVSGQHLYFGFSPGVVSPAQPNKLTYDADSDTVNVEAANFTVDGAAVGGGGPTFQVLEVEDLLIPAGSAFSDWSTPTPFHLLGTLDIEPHKSYSWTLSLELAETLATPDAVHLSLVNPATSDTAASTNGEVVLGTGIGNGHLYGSLSMPIIRTTSEGWPVAVSDGTGYLTAADDTVFLDAVPDPFTATVGIWAFGQSGDNSDETSVDITVVKARVAIVVR